MGCNTYTPEVRWTLGDGQEHGDDPVWDAAEAEALNELAPQAVRVELYADGMSGGAGVRQEMKCVRQLVGASGGYVYSVAVSVARPSMDYTARVIPYFEGVTIPLEDARILWQR